ncbi:mechanosensitive ion channel MscS (plasmid) [Legionella adelaidensis]|uniref:Small-conductance mechanosensitive channel n=1 Tax=Legionella adelaidensis TaxID=45056 RepID=A0A0W0R3K3_9GAMM|nr:mechanosensitive ion channel family protein [Legionella adelaidensis]KTC65627.1 mechanosensitive ion channel MscS [Legionella adelaidensis]VEH85176.1 mechanosensitive ion channel MscS [Legionella adelaidensis]
MDIIEKIGFLHILYALGLVLFGLLVAKKTSLLIEKAVIKKYTRHQAMLVQKIIFYVLLAIFIVSALQELGFRMTALLGAAGILTVAVGFASQTAASNLVSGIFLLFERPFRIGDVIEVKTFQGTVESIDWLSTKIKTKDNTLIRIPNESIMKSEIINYNYFKIRRLKLSFPIAYQNQIPRIREILTQLAEKNELILKQPRPTIEIDNLSEGGLQIKFIVWTKSTDVPVVKNQLFEVLKERLEKEEIKLAG